MQRLIPPKSAVKELNVHQRIQMYSALIARAQMMYSLGKQYGTDRDVYEALGYETTITYEQYASRYARQDMAAAVIDRPVDATWRGRVELQQSPVGGDTKFEKAWKDLDNRLGLKQEFIRLDKVSQIGKYGVLLFGFDGAKTEADFRSPIAPGSARKLVYVKPFGEGGAKINQWENDPSNPRYGMPTLYNIVIYNSETQSSREVTVHYSRVLHIVPTKLESEWEGVPTLQSIYNRLVDLEKLTGGSAEMFWRGARPGYQAVVDPEYTLAPVDRDDLQDQFAEYEHKLRRIMMLEGVEMKALESQVFSPKEHVDVIVQMISAAKGIPKRILTGSEAGELASSQDKGSWLESIDTRRTEYAVPIIIEPFVKRCQEHQILPGLSNGIKWTVKWEDLWAPSDKQQAEIGRMRAEAVRAYGQSPGAEGIMPPRLFYKWCLGLDKDEIAQYEAEMEEMMSAEEETIE